MATVSANDANTLSASAASGANASSAASSTEQRSCDTPDCRVGKLISVVSKGKTAQFVTEPSIQEKPILLNGLTSVFQVTGNAAKLSDIKVASNSAEDANSLKPVYRIKPDSHVHIINYIVVDDDSDVVRKIAENDAQTMRILHESQRVSAEAKLRKLMANHVAVDVNAAVTKRSVHTGVGASEMTTTQAITTTQQTQPAPVQVQQKATPATTTTTTTQPTQVQTLAPTSAQTQAKLGLSIASVAEGVPFISTVPLNALQAPAAAAAATEPASESLSASSIIKMKEELDQLRRTVAQLAAQSTQSKKA